MNPQQAAAYVIAATACACAELAAMEAGNETARRAGQPLPGRHESGRYRMPGQMMTKRGKKNQMQRDFQNCNRRKGKPR